MDKKKRNKIIAIVCSVLVVVVTLAVVLPIYAFPPTVTLSGGKTVSRFDTDAWTEKVYRGYTYTPPTPPSRDGYVFKGWFKDSARITPWLSTDKVTQNITLYAKWEAI